MYVLGVFDDSNNDLKLLEKEQETFQGYMSQLMDEDSFKYEAYSGTKTLEELMEFIESKKDKLTWFHFSGHHDIEGGIKIFDGNFSSLVGHLERCKNLKGVFINGCDSKSTLDKLSSKVPICIGTTKPVYDGIATKFSDKFYKKFLEVNTWKNYDEFFDAFELTKKQIQNLSEADTIEDVNTEARGGGALEDFELADDFYYIAPKTGSAKKIFAEIDKRIDPRESIKVFNDELTKRLIEELKDDTKTKKFLDSIHKNDREHWEVHPDHLKRAQGILEDSFIWVIGSELRRLFAIGYYKDNISMETKIEEYMDTCFKTYRTSLQLIIYIFFSKLWDAKRDRPDVINTDRELIRTFFCSYRKLKLEELRNLFLEMIEIFEEYSIDYPLSKESLGDLKIYSDHQSSFNKACLELETLNNMDTTSVVFKVDNLISAESSLATVLSTFKFFTNCQLMTIKKIEYEESRYSKIRYLKDITILGKEDNDESSHILKIDEKPAKTYSVMFIQVFNNNGKQVVNKVNLFPFLLDFNALINEESFDLYFYEYWDGESGINYFSIKSEDDKVIHFKELEKKQVTGSIAKKDRKNRMKKIRLNLVTKQFEAAMQTLLVNELNVVSMPMANDSNMDTITDIL